ncbi:MAG: sugar transferase [Candidatus Marithrix sp.]
MSYITLVNTIDNINITKRLFDIIISTIILMLLTPIFLIAALFIKYDSKGPIFFSQNRIGKDENKFKMWKFRSMYINAEKHKAELMKQNEMDGGILFKMKNDPRITNIGRFIRKFSIDELPQLWNVLIGDMSLVGPRPPLPKEVEQYTIRQLRRLEVTPGITCIWQVSGRSDISFSQQVELDIKYIENQSLTSDITILLRTIPAVLQAKGSY